VEDDPAIRDAVVDALRSEGHHVDTAPDAHGALDVLRHQPVDAAVVDVRLPAGPDGLELTGILRDRWSIPVLVLTAAAELEDRLAGFDAGADDYLTKPFGMAELIARLRVVLRRAGIADTPASLPLPGGLRLDLDARTATGPDGPIELTRTEFDLLAELAQQRGRVLPKHLLLNAVWGDDVYDDNVVEAHMSNLRRKLRPAHHQLITTVRGVGYRIDR
jgi:DNA-binding response OmpR family regulator